MIQQKNYKSQYKLLKDSYHKIFDDIMSNGLDANGPYSKKLGTAIKKITGRKYVSPTISGTGAIWAAIYALDLIGKKVAIAGYNYEACVHPFATLCKPVFFDCDENMLIDINKIPKGCDALMLVNYNGNVVDYDKVKKKFKGKIIADCSQSLGAKYKGRNDGYFGDVSIFAFGGGKPMGTRGFAGAIATDDKKISEKIDCAINMGKPGSTRYKEAHTLGFRGASQELQCGLTYAGFRYMKEWQKQRQKIIRKIWSELEHLPVRFIKGGKHCLSSYHKIPLEIDNRNDFIKFMKANDIDARLTYATNWSKTFGSGKTMPMSDRLSNSTCNLPLSPFFKEAEVQKIIKTVKKYFSAG